MTFCMGSSRPITRVLSTPPLSSRLQARSASPRGCTSSTNSSMMSGEPSLLQLCDDPGRNLTIEALTLRRFHAPSLLPSTAIDRRQGGGGRQERTKSPADQRRGAPEGAERREAPGSEADGLCAAEAGLKGCDAPRHLDAEGPTPPRHERGDREWGANSIPTGPLGRAGMRHVTVAAMPTRRRWRLGWNLAKVEGDQAETA